MPKRLEKIFLTVFIGGLIVFFLYLRFRLGVERYFDIDEYAHLHWGYSLFAGEKPYTDFFYLFPPFFLYPVAFIFSLLGRNVEAIIAVRIFIFIINIATAGLLFLFGKKMRGYLAGLATVFFFLILPLPSDKMIEVRPDLISVLFVLLGLYFFISAEEKGERIFYFFSGLFYSASLCFVPKTMLSLFPVFLVLIYHAYRRRYLFPFAAGFFLPVLTVLILLFFYGKPEFGIYSMIGMSAAITNALARKFYMRPDLFFYPNDAYYGFVGYSSPYILNLVIYISSSLFAIVRLVSSFSYDDKKKCLREFLVSTTFFANLAAFVFLYPLKHAQYLIPVAVLIPFYFSDLVFSLLSKIKFYWLKSIILISILFFAGLTAWRMYQVKLLWDNKIAMERLKTVLKTLPPKTPVFDLTGTAVFFPNGYYFCCLPYGQYEEALLFKTPDLEKELEKRGTKYVNIGTADRLDVLPIRQAKFIKENFVNFFPDGSMLVKKN